MARSIEDLKKAIDTSEVTDWDAATDLQRFMGKFAQHKHIGPDSNIKDDEKTAYAKFLEDYKSHKDAGEDVSAIDNVSIKGIEETYAGSWLRSTFGGLYPMLDAKSVGEPSVNARVLNALETKRAIEAEAARTAVPEAGASAEKEVAAPARAAEARSAGAPAPRAAEAGAEGGVPSPRGAATVVSARGARGRYTMPTVPNPDAKEYSDLTEDERSLHDEFSSRDLAALPEEQRAERQREMLNAMREDLSEVHKLEDKALIAEVKRHTAEERGVGGAELEALKATEEQSKKLASAARADFRELMYGRDDHAAAVEKEVAAPARAAEARSAGAPAPRTAVAAAEGGNPPVVRSRVAEVKPAAEEEGPVRAAESAARGNPPAVRSRVAKAAETVAAVGAEAPTSTSELPAFRAATRATLQTGDPVVVSAKPTVTPAAPAEPAAPAVVQPEPESVSARRSAVRSAVREAAEGLAAIPEETEAELAAIEEEEARVAATARKLKAVKILQTNFRRSFEKDRKQLDGLKERLANPVIKRALKALQANPGDEIAAEGLVEVIKGLREIKSPTLRDELLNMTVERRVGRSNVRLATVLEKAVNSNNPKILLEFRDRGVANRGDIINHLKTQDELASDTVLQFKKSVNAFEKQEQGTEEFRKAKLAMFRARDAFIKARLEEDPGLVALAADGAVEFPELRQEVQKLVQSEASLKVGGAKGSVGDDLMSFGVDSVVQPSAVKQLAEMMPKDFGAKSVRVEFREGDNHRRVKLSPQQAVVKLAEVKKNAADLPEEALEQEVNKAKAMAARVFIAAVPQEMKDSLRVLNLEEFMSRPDFELNVDDILYRQGVSGKRPETLQVHQRREALEEAVKNFRIIKAKAQDMGLSVEDAHMMALNVMGQAHVERDAEINKKIVEASKAEMQEVIETRVQKVLADKKVLIKVSDLSARMVRADLSKEEKEAAKHELYGKVLKGLTAKEQEEIVNKSDKQRREFTDKVRKQMKADLPLILQEKILDGVRRPGSVIGASSGLSDSVDKVVIKFLNENSHEDVSYDNVKAAVASVLSRGLNGTGPDISKRNMSWGRAWANITGQEGDVISRSCYGDDPAKLEEALLESMKDSVKQQNTYKEVPALVNHTATMSEKSEMVHYFITRDAAEIIKDKKETGGQRLQEYMEYRHSFFEGMGLKAEDLQEMSEEFVAAQKMQKVFRGHQGRKEAYKQGLIKQRDANFAKFDETMREIQNAEQKDKDDIIAGVTKELGEKILAFDNSPDRKGGPGYGDKSGVVKGVSSSMRALIESLRDDNQVVPQKVFIKAVSQVLVHGAGKKPNFLAKTSLGVPNPEIASPAVYGVNARVIKEKMEEAIDYFYARPDKEVAVRQMDGTARPQTAEEKRTARLRAAAKSIGKSAISAFSSMSSAVGKAMPKKGHSKGEGGRGRS